MRDHIQKTGSIGKSEDVVVGHVPRAISMSGLATLWKDTQAICRKEG